MAYESMIAEMIKLDGHNGDSIQAYVARPMGSGPFPGIVLIHHLPGWDEWYRETTRKFAHHGYVAISPNLYERAGEGSAEDVAAKVRADGGVADAQMVGDVDAAMDWLKAQHFSTDKAGVIGTCSGGRHAVIYCSKTDKADACLDLWGGRVVMAEEALNEKLPQAPIDMPADLNCPILGLFGNDDQAPSPEQVNLHEEELRKHGKDYEFHRYDDAGHGFFYYNRPLHRVEQANDGWEKVFAFMKKHVG